MGEHSEFYRLGLFGLDRMSMFCVCYGATSVMVTVVVLGPMFLLWLQPHLDIDLSSVEGLVSFLVLRIPMLGFLVVNNVHKHSFNGKMATLWWTLALTVVRYRLLHNYYRV